MQLKGFLFNRLEFAGSLGDLGTLIPLSIGLVTVNGLDFSSVFLMVGLFYCLSGLYFRLPVPVQPLKVVSAIAIAFPEKVTLEVMGATGLLFGVILMVIGLTGIVDWLARFFTRPIVRGIQLGLGLLLMIKGIVLIGSPNLFIRGAGQITLLAMPLNLLVGLIGVVLVLFLLSSKRFPAALVVVALGLAVAVVLGVFQRVNFHAGPTAIQVVVPRTTDFFNAFFLLVVPQIPLTIGNAIIGTADTARTLFGTGDATRRISNRNLSLSMGLANMATGLLAAMPMCHGAGGLAAHYRFGARTGGANLMIGLVFLVIALAFGQIGVTLLTAIPQSILGVLLLFAGMELALLIRDVSGRHDLFIALFIAGIALATKNMSIAFGSGICVAQLMRWGHIKV